MGELKEVSLGIRPEGLLHLALSLSLCVFLSFPLRNYTGKLEKKISVISCPGKSCISLESGLEKSFIVLKSKH